MGPFYVGDTATLTATFQQSGANADPGAAHFEYRAVDMNGQPLVSTTTVTPVRVSLGVYAVDVDCAAAGTYYWRFWATGVGKAAMEDGFVVKESRFAP